VNKILLNLLIHFGLLEYLFRFGNNYIIFENADFLRNYLLQISKFKKITSKGKIKKLVKVGEFLARPIHLCKACIQ
jgi:hypothetical protein